MTMVPTTVGSMNYNVLANILKKSGLPVKRGAEVGVLHGDTSAYLLKELPQLTLYSVDPWLEYEEVPGERTQVKMNNFENIARGRLREFGDRSQIMKMTSTEAAPLIEDRSLDFVFIDALHTYEAVKADITAWKSKVRPQGILAGHDYTWGGVKEAVMEFQSETGLTGFFTPEASDIWFFVLP